MIKILQYETENIWKEINSVVNVWIKNVVKAGWNVFLHYGDCEELADKLTIQVIRNLVFQVGISENEILNLQRKFRPVFIQWIDKLVSQRWDLRLNPHRINQITVSITRDIIDQFLEEEDFIEFI